MADSGAYSKALNSNSLYWRYYHEPRKAQYGFAFVDGSVKQQILATGEGIVWQSDKLTFVAESNSNPNLLPPKSWAPGAVMGRNLRKKEVTK